MPKPPPKPGERPERNPAIDAAVERSMRRRKLGPKAAPESEPTLLEPPEGATAVPLFVLDRNLTLGPPDGTITITLPDNPELAAIPHVLVLDPRRGAWLPVVLGPPGSKWAILGAERVPAAAAGLWTPGQGRPN